MIVSVLQYDIKRVLDPIYCVVKSEEMRDAHTLIYAALIPTMLCVCCQMIVSLTLERDCGHVPSALHAAPSPSESPSMRRTESVQHLSVELADAKAKIRRLRQEL